MVLSATAFWATVTPRLAFAKFPTRLCEGVFCNLIVCEDVDRRVSEHIGGVRRRGSGRRRFLVHTMRLLMKGMQQVGLMGDATRK